MKDAKLTPKQQRFVDEYLIDGNATAAAARAGYKDPNIGRQLITKHNVAELISARREQLSEATGVTAARVVQELARIAFADARSYVTWGPNGVRLNDSKELTEDQAAAVAEVSETTTKDGGSQRFKLHDKVKALELLGKHLGMFVERIKHEGVVVIEDDNWYGNGAHEKAARLATKGTATSATRSD